MPEFLCFRLHGPLAAWGDVAVGERRPTSPHPSRSAVLGLVAAAAGLRRDDADSLGALDGGLGFATRTEAPGELLVDFHTAQGPDEALLSRKSKAAKKAKLPWRRPATRREELAFDRHELSTLLSQRQYRVDAAWRVALWERSSGAWPLRRLVGVLRAPVFVPYLGRKSCVLDLPMEPQLVVAESPVAAMAAASFHTDDLLAPVLDRGSGRGSVQWEEDWPGLEPVQTVRRRDAVSSRSRWQFTDREEHQSPWVPGRKGGGDVPEQG